MTGEWQPPHTSVLSTQQVPRREAPNSLGFTTDAWMGRVLAGSRAQSRGTRHKDGLPLGSARNSWATLVGCRVPKKIGSNPNARKL